MISIEELEELYQNEFEIVMKRKFTYLKAIEQRGRLDCIRYMRRSQFACESKLRRILRDFELLASHFDYMLIDRRTKYCIFKNADWIMTDAPLIEQLYELMDVQQYFDEFHSMDFYNEWEVLRDGGRYAKGFMEMWRMIEPQGTELEIWKTMLFLDNERDWTNDDDLKKVSCTMWEIDFQ